ncbi:MAG: hypothetical protein EOP83_12030 [Verrucomicrobiaceae bacterium]|nr:MAG: hypothetical protein EOP83_12030 [Verrucomicrobiaceae bacterium]
MNRLFLLLTGLAWAPAALQAGYPEGTLFTAPFGPGGTWNLYKSVSTPMTWTDAQSAAERSVDPLGKTGKPGHLVCIGSAAENMFVYQKVIGRYIWIGLTDSEKRGGKEAGGDRQGGWRWLTGEPYTFQAWRSAEPNSNEATGEDGVAMETPVAGRTGRMARMVRWRSSTPRWSNGRPDLPIRCLVPGESNACCRRNGRSIFPRGTRISPEQVRGPS